MRADLKGNKEKAAKIQKEIDELPDENTIVVQKYDARGRLRPENQKGSSDISALLRDEKNDDGGMGTFSTTFLCYKVYFSFRHGANESSVDEHHQRWRT